MLKLITLNIEMDKHYSRFLPFLDSEKADVICLQEVPESALLYFHERGFATVFAPMIIKKIVRQRRSCRCSNSNQTLLFCSKGLLSRR